MFLFEEDVSRKYNLHSTECFVASQTLVLTKRIHCYSAFLMENEILQFALFTFIYHFLKHKVVIFAEVLKHIYL